MGRLISTEIFLASSWASRCAYLEAHRNREYFSFLENSNAPLSHPKRRCKFIHPKQRSPFRERLELPFPDDEILSGHEEDVSRDRFTTWVKADTNTTLERHVVDVRRALAEHREASPRMHDTPAQECFFDSRKPNRSSVRQRLSIYNWNPSTWKRRRYRKTNFRKMA